MSNVSNDTIAANVIVAFIALFVLGGALYVKKQETINTVQTVYVTTPATGERLVKEVYGTLLAECRQVPWTKKPPERPTCEVISMTAVAYLLVHGSFEQPPRLIEPNE